MMVTGHDPKGMARPGLRPAARPGHAFARCRISDCGVLLSAVVRYRVLITGQVQGVNFRAACPGDAVIRARVFRQVQSRNQ
jgi:hypothetical protein